MDPMTHDLRHALLSVLEADPSPRPAPGDRLAAVLAPLVKTPEPSLVFTVRAGGLSRHAGEISFPGGLQDGGETLAMTALREAREEIGLDLDAADLLGALPAVHTHVSRILVVPFVGMLEALPHFEPSDGEIDEVLVHSLAHLVAAEARGEHAVGDGRTWRGWEYRLDGRRIWGATGRMVHDLLDVVGRRASWSVAPR